MKINKINILFVLEKAKTNRIGKSPLKCRITYLGKRKSFSIGQFVNPNNWNSKQQFVKPLEPDSEFQNSQLSLIKTKI